MPDRPRPSLARLLGQAVLTTLAITTGGALLVVGGAVWMVGFWLLAVIGREG